MTTKVEAAEIWASSTGIRLPDVTRAVAGLVADDRLPRQRSGGGKANVHLQSEHLSCFAFSMVAVAAGVPIVDTATVAQLLFDSVPIETAGKAKLPSLLGGSNLGEGVAALLAAPDTGANPEIEFIFRGQSYPVVVVSIGPEDDREDESYYMLYAGSDYYRTVVKAPIPLECSVRLTSRHLKVLSDRLSDSAKQSGGKDQS